MPRGPDINLHVFSHAASDYLASVSVHTQTRVSPLSLGRVEHLPTDLLGHDGKVSHNILFSGAYGGILNEAYFLIFETNWYDNVERTDDIFSPTVT